MASIVFFISSFPKISEVLIIHDFIYKSLNNNLISSFFSNGSFLNGNESHDNKGTKYSLFYLFRENDI